MLLNVESSRCDVSIFTFRPISAAVVYFDISTPRNSASMNSHAVCALSCSIYSTNKSIGIIRDERAEQHFDRVPTSRILRSDDEVADVVVSLLFLAPFSSFFFDCG